MAKETSHCREGASRPMSSSGGHRRNPKGYSGPGCRPALADSLTIIKKGKRIKAMVKTLKARHVCVCGCGLLACLLGVAPPLPRRHCCRHLMFALPPERLKKADKLSNGQEKSKNSSWAEQATAPFRRERVRDRVVNILVI